MSKPIEPGCRAIIVGHPYEPNNGIEVTVLEYLGKLEDSHGERWRISEKITRTIGPEQAMVSLVKSDSVDHVNEAFLQRIDYDGNEASTWSAVKDACGWQPIGIATTGEMR